MMRLHEYDFHHFYTYSLFLFFFFFFNDTATTEIYTLSLHDALPIYQVVSVGADIAFDADPKFFACLVRHQKQYQDRKSGSAGMPRPISYAVFCLKKKNTEPSPMHKTN